VGNRLACDKEPGLYKYYKMKLVKVDIHIRDFRINLRGNVEIEKKEKQLT